MPSKKRRSLERLADRELVTSRVLDATPGRVFAAWTDPDRLARWWGPAGFTNTFQEIAIRPGGAWRFVMHGPEGTDYRNESVFVEVAEPERIVLDHVSGPRFRLTATFTEHAGRTLLTWHMLFESAAVCAKVRVYAVPANEENLDRLAAEVARL
jgi:uncharacterized protein YndB with AHSA1/START domain